MKYSVLLVCFLLASFLLWSTTSTSAQPGANSPAPLSPEEAKIEQLFKEIRELLGQGKPAEAGAKAAEAVTLSQQMGDQKRLARAIFQVANADYHTGQIEKAIANFKQAAQLAGEAGDTNWQSISLNTAAILLTGAGLSEEALYFYHQSLALRRQQKDIWNEAFVLQQMTPLYLDAGNIAQAELNLQEAMRLIREFKASGKDDKGLEDYILLQTSGLELARGNTQQAILLAQNFLAKETPRTSGVSKIEIRGRLGDMYRAISDFEKAATIYEELLGLARQYKIPQVEAGALGNLAWAKLKLGQAAEALPLITRALELLRQVGGGRDEGNFLSYLAEIQAALGQQEAALATYRRTISTIERERTSIIPTEMAKANLVATRHNVFTRTIDFLLAQQRAEEALEIAEAYHARAFLDVLAESRIDLRRDLPEAQKTRENELFVRIAKIQKELWQPALSAVRAAELQNELQSAENDLTVFQVELRRANPRYASVKYPQPLRPEKIAPTLLDDNTALIEYVLGETKSFAWVVRPGKIQAITLPTRKDISEQITRYRAVMDEKISALTAAQNLAQLNTVSSKLYQTLIQPLETQLSGARKLIVVPDGMLVYLPFETLARKTSAQKTEYLLERFAISYAPSATALTALKNLSASSTATSQGLLAFGDPVYTEAASTLSQKTVALNATRAFDLRNLPNTRREVTEIAALFPLAERQTFLGADAREQQVKNSALEKYRYLHFAAHGIVDENFPARSGIVLSAEKNSPDDGVLQMSEVMRLKLNANIVTLSACRTGLGKLLNGEGMIGLTRAFLYAGAKSVVVSLWNVNDAATAPLMKAFYKNLQQGKAKDEALRQAKLTMLKGQQRAWRHPYFWAAFVLIGEPK